MIFSIFRKCVLSSTGRNVNFDACRKFVFVSLISQNKAISVKRQCFKPNLCNVEFKFIHYDKVFHKNAVKADVKGIQENISALRAKQGPLRKKKSMSTAEKVHTPGIWNVKSLSTAEEYNLEALMQGIMSQELYTAATIYESTCWLYALDLDEHGDVAVEMGIAYPDNFVLKPQREGGSNNMYGVDIKHFLSFIRDKKDRAAWILMDKIYPPLHKSYIIRPESNTNMEVQELVSELGIFGIIIANEDGIFINKQGGHMLRTKLATANEGGVASGLGACDSPYLID